MILPREINYGLSRALIITRRELRDQFRDWRIVIPIIVLTLFFPVLMNFTAQQAVEFANRYGATIVAERFIPFLMLVVGFFPISISLVIALESFVGEKERKSIEPLLVSPMTDIQLYMGKVLASTIPPLLAAYLGIMVYIIGLMWSLNWQPDPILVLLVVVLTTVQALVMVAGAVVISTQATSVRAANLLASFIIIPMALLLQGEAIIMFWARYNVLWLFVGGLFIILMLLMRMGVQLFNREELLGREMDELKLGRLAREFWREFVGKARSPWQWWRYEVPGAVRHLRIPIVAIALMLVLAMALGWNNADVYQIPPQLLDFTEVDADEFLARLDEFGMSSASGIGFVLFQNVRALAIATLLGIFTVGVLAVIILMLPFIILGFLMGQFWMAGYSPLLFFGALVLPHGLLEIPAAILLGAAVLRLGASMISPPDGKTLTMGWVSAFADWAKIALGLTVPLLIGAAIIEVLVTPQIAAALLFGG